MNTSSATRFAALPAPPQMTQGSDRDGASTILTRRLALTRGNCGAELRSEYPQNNLPDLLGWPAVAVRAREHVEFAGALHDRNPSRGAFPCVTNHMSGATYQQVERQVEHQQELAKDAGIDETNSRLYRLSTRLGRPEDEAAK